MAVTVPRMSLPIQKSAPSKQWANQKFLMIGQAGCGKSTFWSNDEKTLFINTEGNLGHLATMQMPVRSWEDMQEAYLLLTEQAAKKEPFPYSTLVIDTADQLLVCAEEYVIQRAKEKYKNPAVKDNIHVIGDVPEGNGWANTTKLMMQCVRKLSDLPCALAVIAHLKNVKVEEPTAKYDKETISLWGNIGVGMLSYVQHTMHIQCHYVGDSLRRTVRTLPSKGLESKSHGGLIPDGMVWETADLKEEWQKFRGLFD